MNIRAFFRLVMIQHTLFALPLALTGAILAARGLPDWSTLVLVALAFTAARSAAMAFNRVVDRRWDALNPRTAQREIPTGKITALQTGLLTIISSVSFVIVAFALNDLCGWLSPVVLVILLGYSYTKRFTTLCHYFLGTALGLAPISGWLAVTGEFSWPPILLGLGVVFWTAGFDTIYACQDIAFDRENNLFSLPAKFGIKTALRLSSLSHITAFVLFLSVGLAANLAWPYFGLCCLTGLLLLWEHRLVSPEDMSKLDLAFFKANSLVSASLLLAVSIGLMF